MIEILDEHTSDSGCSYICRSGFEFWYQLIYINENQPCEDSYIAQYANGRTVKYND